ncbi:MAG: PucC family protein [Gemmobacter sp.]
MNSDLMLVVGIIAAVLAIPSLLSAYSESRPPRVAAILIMIASVLVVVAIWQKPSGYTLEEIPRVFVRVFGRFFN